MANESPEYDIPEDIEIRVLEILDSTPPGPERQASLDAIQMSPKVRQAVDAWLAEDEASSGFLQSPPEVSRQSDAPGALPRRMGDYDLLEILGKGGMGVVYRARDLRLGRDVALKALPEHFADNQKRLLRFEREVRAVAALRHQNIVPVYEAGRVGNVPYFTMELVAGRSLDQVIQALKSLDRPVGTWHYRDWLASTGRSPLGTLSGNNSDRTYISVVCHLIIGIAEALQHAHDHRIIHRDVKPSNVMAEGGDSAKLFDFGLARLEDDAAMTRTSELVGSPHYMSPEQVSGEVLDYRSDIYSLGITMYELLTLNVPFAGSSPQDIYKAISHREPKRPGLLNPHLPKDLETICVTAAEKNPDRRYQTAADMADDIRRFLRFEPIQARPIGAVTRSARWLRRNRASVSILVLLTIALVFFLMNTGLEGKVQEAEKALSALESDKADITAELGRLEEARDELQSQVEDSTASLAELIEQRDTAQGSLDQAQSSLDQAQESLDEAQDRQESVQEQLTATRTNLESTRANLASTRTDLTTTRGDLDTVREDLRSAQAQLSAAELDRTKAEVELATAEKDLGNVKESNRITTINRLLMEANFRRTRNSGLGLLLAHTAANLAEADDDSGLQTRVDDTLLDLLRLTQEQRVFSHHVSPLTAIDFSPSGRHLISASSDGVAFIWERSTGEIVDEYPGTALLSRAPLLHAEYADLEGTAILLAREDGNLVVWDTRSRSAQLLPGVHHQEQIHRHSHPDSPYILAHDDESRGRLVAQDLANPDRRRTLGDAESPITNFDFHPGGRQIVAATTDDQIQIWDLETGDLITSTSSSTTLIAASYSADGTRIAALLADGTAMVLGAIDLETYSETRIDDAPIGSGRIAFCAEDQRLLISASGTDSHHLLRAVDGVLVKKLDARSEQRDFRLDGRNRILACISTEGGGFDLFDTRNGFLVARLQGHGTSAQYHQPQVAFSPDGDSIATVSGDNHARIWRARAGGMLTALVPSSTEPEPGRIQESLHTARFSPGGIHVITADDLGLGLWDIRGTRIAHVLHDPRRILSTTTISADGAYGVCFTDGRVTILNSVGPRFVSVLPVAIRDLHQVSAWPGGLVALTTAGNSPQRELSLVDTQGVEKQTLRLPPLEAGGGTPLPSLDGSRFAVGYSDLTIVSASNPAESHRLPFSRRPIAFSPDGRRVAASTGFSVKVWDTSTWENFELDSLPQDQSELTALAFSPDGQNLASGWSDGTILVHDCTLAPGQRVPVSFSGHRRSVRSLAYSHDGSLLLTSSDDGTAKVWHSITGESKLTFSPGESTDVRCVYAEFSQDDKRILVVCPGAAYVLPLDVRRLAEQSVHRELTQAERIQFGLEVKPNR